MQSKQKNFSIESFGNAANNKKIINYLIKTDVQGSCEAITNSLKSIENPDVGLEIVYSGVGGITESDINLA
jgi:translation initiation factor IF-2